MLTRIYVEALLVDEELADQDWEAWITGKISSLTASLMWLLIVDRDAASLFSVCSSCVNKPGKIHKSEHESRTNTKVPEANN